MRRHNTKPYGFLQGRKHTGCEPQRSAVPEVADSLTGKFISPTMPARACEEDRNVTSSSGCAVVAGLVSHSATQLEPPGVWMVGRSAME